MGKLDTKQDIERLITDSLQDRGQGAVIPDFLLDRINEKIESKEKGNCSMNKGFRRIGNGIKGIKGMKPVIVASIIIIVTAATSFAATQITSFVSHSTKTFDEFPTAKQVKAAVEFIPDYVESFSNGYYFKEASVSNTKAVDDDNNKVSAFQGISFYYTKDGAIKGQILSLSTDPKLEGVINTERSENEKVIPFGDVSLIYSKVAFKVTPEGYVPTEEEEERMARGELWISSGSDQIEETNIQYVRWVKDEISYTLMDHGFEIDEQTLVEMAKEVIGD